MIAGKTLSLPLVALSLLTLGGNGYTQDGFLGKVFKWKKSAVTPADESQPVATTPAAPASSQNAFRAVSSSGKIIDQAPGTVAPPRRIAPAKPSKAKPGQYAPVPSSALGVSALNRPPKGAADAARSYPQKPAENAASKHGKKSNGVYRSVSSDGTVVTGETPRQAPAIKAAAPAPVVSSFPKPNDWTQKRQDSLPPIPTLYDPTTQVAPTTQVVPAPSAQVTPIAAAKPLPFPVSSQPVPAAAPSRPSEYAADPRAEAEVERILEESPSDPRQASPPEN